MPTTVLDQPNKIAGTARDVDVSNMIDSSPGVLALGRSTGRSAERNAGQASGGSRRNDAQPRLDLPRYQLSDHARRRSETALLFQPTRIHSEKVILLNRTAVQQANADFGCGGEPIP